MEDEKKRTIDEERQELIDALEDMQVDTEEYRQVTSQLETLTRIKKLEVETSIAQEKMEREANLAESKAKAELHLKEEEVLIKKKESRRGIWKTLIAVAAGIAQIVVINHYEDIKPQIGKAWNMVFKPKL